MTGHVYVIDRGDGVIKIGMTSREPSRRIKEVQKKACFIAVNTYVTEKIGSSRNVEKHAHNLLKRYDVGGEWFTCTFEEGMNSVDKAVKSCSTPPVISLHKKSTLATFEVPETYAEWLKGKAETHCTSVNAIRRNIIREAMDRDKKVKK
jgi:predicted GIY-YIG superfamily endonuclease